MEPADIFLGAADNLLEKYDQFKSVLASLEKVLQKQQVCFATTKRNYHLKPRNRNYAESTIIVHTAVEFYTSWKLLAQVGIENPGPTLYLEITDLIYQKMIKESFPVHHIDTGPVDQSITYEDANIVQYAAGYVCRKIKEKLCKTAPQTNK